MALLATSSLAKAPCPVCGAGSCACKNPRNDTTVGRPLDLALLREEGGRLIPVRAEEDILQDVPGMPGLSRVLYRKGEFIREDDAEVLGLTQRKAAVAPPQDKAKRGPREQSKQRASRDKALTKKEED